MICRLLAARIAIFLILHCYINSILSFSPPIISPSSSVVYNTPVNLQVSCPDADTWPIALNLSNTEQQIDLSPISGSTSWQSILYSNISLILYCQAPTVTSNNITVDYTIEIPPPDPPVVQPNSGKYLYTGSNFSLNILISIASDEFDPSSVQIFWTQGTNRNVTISSESYTNPISLVNIGSYSIQAKTFRIFGNNAYIVEGNSQVSMQYSIVNQCSIPQIRTQSGLFENGEMISIIIIANEPNAVLYYSISNGTYQYYNGTLNISANNSNVNLQVYQDAPGCFPSQVVNAIYTFRESLSPPVMQPSNTSIIFYHNVTISFSCNPSEKSFPEIISPNDLIETNTSLSNVSFVLTESTSITVRCASVQDILNSSTVTSVFTIYSYTSAPEPVVYPPAQFHIGPLTANLTCQFIANCQIWFTTDSNLNEELIYPNSPNVTLYLGPIEIIGPGFVLLRAISNSPDFERESSIVSTVYYTKSYLHPPIFHFSSEPLSITSEGIPIFLNSVNATISNDQGAFINYCIANSESEALELLSQQSNILQSSPVQIFNIQQNSTFYVKTYLLHYISEQSMYNFSVQVIMEQQFNEGSSITTKNSIINRWKSKWLALIVILSCLILCSFFICIYLIRIMRKRVNRYMQIRRYRIINQRFINMGLALDNNEDDLIFD